MQDAPHPTPKATLTSRARAAASRSRSRGSRWASPWAFFAVAVGWSWLFWGLDIAFGHGTTTALGTALAFTGLLGPMLAGIGFTLATRDRAGRRDYWARLLRPGRIPARWFAVILLLAPVVLLVAAGLDLALGGGLSPYREAAQPFLDKPWLLLPFALNLFLIGPVPEEFGWRGYALDRLLERRGALASSLILGVVWAAWHLPLFYMRGTYQFEQGAGSLWFWLFMIGIVPLTVVFTWVYRNTRRSTLAIIVLHFMVVLSCDLLNTSTGSNLISTALWIVLAAIVTLVPGLEPSSGAATAPRRPGAQRPLANRA